jgi:ABC-type multidrug transport system fused ATPase/permease subunit
MTVKQAYVRATRYFRDDLGRIILSTVLIGISAVTTLAQPLPLGILIDAVLEPKKDVTRLDNLFLHLAPYSRATQVLILASSVLLLRLIQEGVDLVNGVLKIKVGYSGLLHVRRDLYRKFQELSISYHRSRPQGDAIYRLITDTNGFQTAFNIAQTVAVNAVKLIALAWIMMAMNWKLGLVAIAIWPVLFMAIRKYGTVLMGTTRRAAQVESQLTTTIQRSVALISLVQAFGREQDEFNRFNNDVRSSHDAWTKMYIQTMVYWFIIGMTFVLGLSLVIGFGGFLILGGSMTVGVLTVFVQYLTTQVYDPLYKLSGSGAEMLRGATGMIRVYEILDTPTTVQDAPDAIELPKQPRVLKLDHVGFGYRPDAPVLRDVSAIIQPGEMVGFVGSSGVGKSSLLNLLPRFYDPTAGALYFDDIDLRKIKLKSLRRHIALVLQDSAILAASVAENIAYGRPDASEADLRHAAELAGADAFIESLPQKYQTVLDEAGQNLSGGQKQRINIARALATEAPILVLDEPTSALDPQNEQMITETLAALKGKRTIVLVSHRLSTVADCDRIYVMDGGRVIEVGTHDELLARRGHYFKMAKHQMKLHEAPATT